MPHRPHDRLPSGAKPGATRQLLERRERFTRARREALQPDGPVGALRLAHRQGGAGKSGPAHPQTARHRERRAPPRRGARAARRSTPEIVRPGVDRRTAAARRRASGPLCRSRSPALARDRGDRAVRHRAGARPDHRSAQCRRDPAHRRGLRRRGDRHHRAPQPGGDRRAGEVRVRRARIRADRDGAESRPRARRR